MHGTCHATGWWKQERFSLLVYWFEKGEWYSPFFNFFSLYVYNQKTTIMRAYRIDRGYREPSLPTLAINQSIVVKRKGKKVNAKVKSIGSTMIDVTANGKTFTCAYSSGQWIIQGV